MKPLSATSVKVRKITEILNVALFLGLLLLPIAYTTLLEHKEGTPSNEKRPMAERPALRLALDVWPEFTSRFERYYNDSFGFREKLIRWNNLARIGLLNESPIRSVRLGKAGWLFYADEWVLEDYENVMPFKAEDLAAIRRILEERRAWLAGQGIRFFIVVAPNKHTIYSEYLPSSIQKMGKESRLDQVSRYLEAYPEIEFIDLRTPLLAAKSTERLYHRTDTHWNDYGAFIGYQAIMERIAKQFPKVKKLAQEDFIVTAEREQGGDLSGILSLKDLLGEERITLTPGFTPRAVNGIRAYADPAREPGREMVVKETGDPTLPKLLVFRDSFSSNLIPYLSESFQSSVFIWTHAFLPEIVKQEKPDVVILECVERYLGALSIENPEGVKGASPGMD